MITEQIKTPPSTTNTSYNRTPSNANKKPVILASKNVITKLQNYGFCRNCLQKDELIYPGSSFILCLNCDKKQLYEELEEYLISLSICPKCEQKDSILRSSSSFRTCIKCDVAINLQIVAQDSKK